MGKHVTLIMVGSATGEMALPYVIATYIGEVADAGNSTQAGGGVGAALADPNEGKSPLVLMVVVTVAGVGMIALLLLLIRLGHEARALKPAEPAAGGAAAIEGAAGPAVAS
jgi:hypothetical protein